MKTQTNAKQKTNPNEQKQMQKTCKGKNKSKQKKKAKKALTPHSRNIKFVKKQQISVCHTGNTSFFMEKKFISYFSKT